MNSPRLLTAPAGMRNEAEQLRGTGNRIAVVPTMGALHQGHASLIRIARGAADVVITTVFVNPSQFGPGEDYTRYPRDLRRDVEIAGEAGADIVFAPPAAGVYPDGYATWVTVEGVTEGLEGGVRPGHFRGVATVVTKIFNMTRPHLAVFGQKDAQQVAVIRRMTRDLDFGVEILVAPTVREPDGLAMSSRNAYLSPDERREAPVLYRSLRLGEELLRGGERDAARVTAEVRRIIRSESRGEVDYVSLADGETLREIESVGDGPMLLSLAVRFGATRLIDNIPIPALHTGEEIER
jgi:pantoate--beta-alanine ligase